MAKGNFTKGRPHLFGRPNKSRTGMPKPLGSGTPTKMPGPVTNFTLRVSVAELERWRTVATSMTFSIGDLVRAAVTDYLEELEDDA